jgi:O-antigen ligase
LVEDDAGKRRVISFYAHNLYVQTLYSTGLLGLLGMCVAFWYALAGMYRLCAAGAGPPAQLFLVWLFMQFTYYVPYGQDYLQCLIFGVAVAYVSGCTVVQGKPPALVARGGVAVA